MIGLTLFCSCDEVKIFDLDITLKHPVQQLAEEAAMQEPSLETLLLKWGYSKEQINKPHSVSSYQPHGEVRLIWIAKHTNKHIQIVWYQKDETHPLLLTDNIMHIPSILQTKEEPLGLRIHVLDEMPYSVDLDAQQNNGEERVKVYPDLQDGKEGSFAFILCWEVDGDRDYNDVILRIENVEIVPQK